MLLNFLALHRQPAVPYILPFAAFMAMLVLQQAVPVPVWLRFVVCLAIILAVSARPLAGGPSRPLLSVGVGLMVFVLWVGPDVISPAWHHTLLFENPIMGHPAGNTPPASRYDPVFLVFRVLVSVVAVPILEELFWRAWLMRWLINTDFEKVPLGAYTPASFWIVALLFASEHGSFWDVGLLAGIVYNILMIRTRNLWDCILAHAITNGALAAYVVLAGQWQYWL
jgi:CAAX prenyl protease-like protein